MVLSVVESWTPRKSMADFGRLELKKAEAIMACRTEFVPSQPLKDIKITVSLNMTAQTGVFVETLTALGAQVRCCSGSNSSTLDHVAAAIARDGTDVFARKDQTLKEYWRCKVRDLDWGPSGGPHLIIDHSGDLTMLIYEGTKAEKEFASTGIVPDPACTDDVTFNAMLAVIGEGLSSDPMKFHKINDGIVGATIGEGLSCDQMQNSDTLLYSKIKFANYLTGSCHSLPDDLMNATNVMIAGKVALVAGYGDIGRGCAAALKKAGARVIVTENDPVCAHQATMKGIQVRTLKDAVSEVDIFVTTTGYKDMIMVDDMRKMKNNAILCNIGSFVSQTDMVGLETFPGVKRINISPITDRWVFSDTGRAIIVVAEGRPMNLSYATGPPNCAISSFLTSQVFSLLELWNERSSGKYEKKVYDFPKHLDQKIAALHHENLREDRADHISLQVEGDHQPANNVQVEGDNQPANDRDRAGQCLEVFGLVVSCLGVILGVAKLVLVYGVGSN